MSYSVILPAAGAGVRMGGPVPKAYLTLDTEDGPVTLLELSARAFLNDPDCSLIVICCPADAVDQTRRMFAGECRVSVVAGGVTRQQSVRIGVSLLAAAVSGESSKGLESTVLVHDAARCCVPRQVISNVLRAVSESGAATAAVRVVDAMVHEKDGFIGASIDRTNVWAIQTPQGFRIEDLLRAHEDAAQRGLESVDDTGLVGNYRAIRLVEGSRRNIKVTTPEDLSLATRLMKVLE